MIGYGALLQGLIESAGKYTPAAPRLRAIAAELGDRRAFSMWLLKLTFSSPSEQIDECIDIPECLSAAPHVQAASCSTEPESSA